MWIIKIYIIRYSESGKWRGSNKHDLEASAIGSEKLSACFSCLFLETGSFPSEGWFLWCHMDTRSFSHVDTKDHYGEWALSPCHCQVLARAGNSARLWLRIQLTPNQAASTLHGKSLCPWVTSDVTTAMQGPAILPPRHRETSCCFSPQFTTHRRNDWGRSPTALIGELEQTCKLVWFHMRQRKPPSHSAPRGLIPKEMHAA